MTNKDLAYILLLNLRCSLNPQVVQSPQTALVEVNHA
jgi:hypothetical protein